MKKQKKYNKKRKPKYEQKLALNATFEEVIKLSVQDSPKPKK
jgi:hypothetical protein